jgi:hypothetical protein
MKKPDYQGLVESHAYIESKKMNHEIQTLVRALNERVEWEVPHELRFRGGHGLSKWYASRETCASLELHTSTNGVAYAQAFLNTTSEDLEPEYSPWKLKPGDGAVRIQSNAVPTTLYLDDLTSLVDVVGEVERVLLQVSEGIRNGKLSPEEVRMKLAQGEAVNAYVPPTNNGADIDNFASAVTTCLYERNSPVRVVHESQDGRYFSTLSRSSTRRGILRVEAMADI